ncbi:MAG: hypothetical protein IJF80_04605 [Clostridia bacterium]|nr:hypothetical protein [Clostridia bacterium]
MKRSILFLLTVILCVISLLPTSAYAKTYTLADTDISLSIDETSWYVFTRENIKDNKELAEFEITYEYMNELFLQNKVYMDAVLCFEDGNYIELFVRKNPVDSGMVNLSNYEYDDVSEIAKAFAEQLGSEKYSVYENNYKFARLDYFDSTLNFHLCEFITVVNKESYTFTFQATSQFTDWDYKEIESIVNSIHFDVDTSLKEKKTDSFWGNVLTKTVIGAAVGGITGAIIAAVNKNKKKRSENSDVPPTGPTETNL